MPDTPSSKSDPNGRKAELEAAPAAAAKRTGPAPGPAGSFWRRWQEWVEREEAAGALKAAGGH